MGTTRKIISLFSGAGGMDIGFEEAGFEVAVAVEVDSACCETLRANRPALKIINKSIVDVSGEEILGEASLGVGEAALVVGGPPCQSFSLAGRRRGLDDERGRLLFEYVRVVRETLPAGFVLENVKGLTNWDGGRALQSLVEELERPIDHDGTVYRYHVSPPKVLNAVDYGVPQVRERLILVGNRMGKKFCYPAPSAAPRRTVWDAIGGLPKPDKPSDVAVRVSKIIKARIEKYGY